MAQKDIKFYMQKEKPFVEGEPTEKVYDLEKDFSGLKYSSCKGLLSKGRRKNIYTESYHDSDELRVWQGEEVFREATSISFTFYFIGEDRQSVYQSFYDYVKNGKIRYWDTKRKKEALLVFQEAIEVSEDAYKGSTPYIMVDFKFQNLWGETQDVTQ